MTAGARLAVAREGRECRDLPKNVPTNSEGFRKAVEVLRPHWQEINQQWELDIREYEKFLKNDTSNFGRVIKCHLISEIYLERYLTHKHSLENLTEVRLSYRQMVKLLPKHSAAPAFFRPGLLTLNELRNKFAHRLDYTLSKNELSTMTDMLVMSERPVSTMNAIEMVEKFTALSCACLNPTPSKIEKLFAKAMKHIVVENRPK